MAFDLTLAVLKLRNAHPFFDMLCAPFTLTTGTQYHFNPRCIINYDNNGRLTYFNPNPNYPRDFGMFDAKTNTLDPATDEELKRRIEKRMPKGFAHCVSIILNHKPGNRDSQV